MVAARSKDILFVNDLLINMDGNLRGKSTVIKIKHSLHCALERGYNDIKFAIYLHKFALKIMGLDYLRSDRRADD